MIADTAVVSCLVRQAQNLIAKAEELAADGVSGRSVTALDAMFAAAAGLIVTAQRLDPVRAETSALGSQTTADLLRRCGTGAMRIAP